MKYIAKTMSGFENLLAEEISNLGGSQIEMLNRAVSFEGDIEVLYQVNLWARTAIRVIQPILEFKAHNETVLYKRLRRYDWTNLIPLDKTFKINSNVHSEVFTHSKYVALKTKDAIVDTFREKYNGERPNIELENPDFLLDVHCNKVDFVISIDSSGESLHKRGYRQKERRAPLNETLAAGMIMLSGWDKKMPLLDPMCGSGTILIEALLIARNIPPRFNRTHFAFMNWPEYNDELWRTIKLKSLATVKEGPVPLLFGFDIDPDEYAQTKKLLKSLDMDTYIDLHKIDFFSHECISESGFIITNPPYGLRIEQDDINDFYKNIGDTFKKHYQGWTAWVLSGNKEALKFLGLRTSKKMTLYNGAIECKYHRYDLYRGSKKQP